MAGEPVPVIDWDATEQQWLDARRSGIGASEVAAALGMSRWRTPWQVWADKTGAHRRDRDYSDAAELGTALEPWLLNQAAMILGEPVERTPDRLYSHLEHPWQLASPDGQAKTGALVECKTAGLVGRVDTDDWADGSIPLSYEFQTRWQMHVMDVPACHVVGLVAGLGVVLVTVDRDLAVEAEMVRQVSQWWDRYVVAGEEPPIGAGDLAALAERWPAPDGGYVDLDDTPAASLLALRRNANTRLVAAKSELDDIDARLRGLIGPHGEAFIDNRIAYSLPARRGSIDWKAIAAGLLADRPDIDPETYRRASTRYVKIAKEWQ